MTCGKAVYNSLKKAEKYALEASMQNREIGHPELVPYKCEFCRKYHLTSRRRDISKAEKKILTKEREFILKESEHYINKIWRKLK